MIYPQKDKRFEVVFQLFVHYQLKKQFYRIYIDMEEAVENNQPTLFIANHSSWWDSLISFYINRVLLKHDSYAMMSEEGINSFPFFRKIGAFSVNPASPKHVMKSLLYARELLREKKSVWIFPQGKEEHLEKRPLQFSDGPAFIMLKEKSVQAIPIAYCYSFRHDQRPELFIKVGKRIEVNTETSRNELTYKLEQAVTTELDSIKSKLVSEDLSTFEVFMVGKKTVSEWLTWWKEKVKR
ncbi:lysophospholipid acyltransferase family protein [Priestia flexa]|uniref:lysophospholipid acyltransferase family protein n=1 Tax=Priestia flexa TaxID=86664 RepID=UPI001B33625E|nr:lysophospholipid acyltransferase family protein [Priestia flexa]